MPSLALGVGSTESGFISNAVSPRGAIGIFQVMPQTGAQYGVYRHELFDPDINIQVGILYLKDMLEHFKNTDLALAAYNAGPGRVVDAGNKIPKIKETQNYVRRVKHAAKKYRNNRTF